MPSRRKPHAARHKPRASSIIKDKIIPPGNKDNKVKLLVTVFAISSFTQDNFVTGDKTGPLQIYCQIFARFLRF